MALPCSLYLASSLSQVPLACRRFKASSTASRSPGSFLETGMPVSCANSGCPSKTQVLASMPWKYGKVSLPCTATSMRPVLSWVRASTEPSVPITVMAGLPLASQLSLLQPAIWPGQLVLRLAPTLVPQTSAIPLIRAALACRVKNCGPVFMQSMKSATFWRSAVSLMATMAMSARPVVSELKTWAKAVSWYSTFRPSSLAMAAPRSMSSPISSPVAGSLQAMGGQLACEAMTSLPAFLMRSGRSAACAALAARVTVAANVARPNMVLCFSFTGFPFLVEFCNTASGQDGRDEFLRAPVLRACQHFAGGAGFDHLAAIHEHHPVGHFTCKAQFMRDHDHGHAAPGKILHHRQHFAHQLRVQCRGRLVEQHQLGPHGQCAGNRHALLLATGKFRRIGIGLARQPHPGQQGQCLFLHIGATALLHHHRAFHDVLQRRHVGEQVEALEHHAAGQALAGDLAVRQFDQLVATPAIAQQFTADPDGTAVDAFQLVDAAQEGTLARAGGTDDAGHRAGLDLQVHALERVEAAIVFMDLMGHDHGTVHHCPPCTPAARVRTLGRRSRANSRSRKCWPMENTVTTARYQTVATISSSITRALAKQMVWALCRISENWITLATEVSLIMLITSLPTGGMITRMACGSTMRRKAVRRVMPIALAASVWPLSTARMPPRTTSAVQAPCPMPSPSRLATKGVMMSTVRASNQPGMPRVGNTSARLNHSSICSSRGVPRKNQMQKVATALSSLLGDITITAKTTPSTMPTTIAQMVMRMVFRSPCRITLAVMNLATTAHSIWPWAKACTTKPSASRISAADSQRPQQRRGTTLRWSMAQGEMVLMLSLPLLMATPPAASTGAAQPRQPAIFPVEPAPAAVRYRHGRYAPPQRPRA
eukprot:TRINITY_DN427_c3_g1_i1.p1 TRINITY_DN427_c3_g1~~TRINITY_DN427_c3_g1_i1.p1  ORF type:complete len:882 (+),score=278.44 TRINITY_DN427_c3_g1_i1:1771-4416(+)